MRVDRYSYEGLDLATPVDLHVYGGLIDTDCWFWFRVPGPKESSESRSLGHSAHQHISCAEKKIRKAIAEAVSMYRSA